MKRSVATTVSWEVDPARQWVSKTEHSSAGDRTVVYRPGRSGTVASWWETKQVQTDGQRAHTFEVGTPCFESVSEPFTQIVTRAQQAIAAQPRPVTITPPVMAAQPAVIPPALSYLSSRP